MTDPITGQRVSWQRLFLNSLPLATLLGTVLAFLLTVFTAGMIALFADRVREELGLASSEQITTLTEALSDLKAETKAQSDATQAQIGEMRRLVDIALRPDEIVHYRDLPRAAERECEAGEACAIVIFAERDPLAVDCRIIPGRTELRITAEGREYVARSLPNRMATNLAPRPQALEPTFALPVSLPPGPATALIRSYYTNCQWQRDGVPPAVQDSPFFTLEIVE